MVTAEIRNESDADWAYVEWIDGHSNDCYFCGNFTGDACINCKVLLYGVVGGKSYKWQVLNTSCLGKTIVGGASCAGVDGVWLNRFTGYPASYPIPSDVGITPESACNFSCGATIPACWNSVDSPVCQASSTYTFEWRCD